jgi:hypothetical protein
LAVGVVFLAIGVAATVVSALRRHGG